MQYLTWVLGHKGTKDNETADQLARTVSLHPFIGPKPACGISETAAGQATRDWTINKSCPCQDKNT
jgi:ribonuclease HI